MTGPSFSWSKSRQHSFESCKRRYYYAYYGYWNGWSINAPPKVRKLYFCKNLKNLDAITGVIVHEVIKDFWTVYHNTGERLQLAELLRKANSEWLVIRENVKSRKYKNTKKTLGILEFDKSGWDDKIFSDYFSKTKHLLSNFYNYAIGLHINPEQIYATDDHSIGFFAMPIEGVSKNVNIYAIADLIYTVGYNDIITDWKTGLLDEEKDMKIQMLVYGCWLLTRKNADYDGAARIKYRIVNLFRGDYAEYQYPSEDYSKFLDWMKKSIQEMYEYDYLNRVEESYPYAEKISTCMICEYRNLCDNPLIPKVEDTHAKFKT
jgi:hypothetical protein